MDFDGKTKASWNYKELHGGYALKKIVKALKNGTEYVKYRGTQALNKKYNQQNDKAQSHKKKSNTR